jgi:CheY-like chemotaxis protein
MVSLVMTQSDPSEIHKRLKQAKETVQSVGQILQFYSSAIRTIVSAPSILRSDDPLELNKFARTTTFTPINISPTLCEYFQVAAKELYPREYKILSEHSKPKIREVLSLMKSNEILAVLAVTYYFKLVSKKIDRSELSLISPLISAYLKNGAIIGSQLSDSFGRGGGMIACGLRCLGLITLLTVDLEGFKQLRKRIEKNGTLDNFDFELKTFGLTHLDLASALAGELGFGSVAREAFITLDLPKAQPSSSAGICWRHSLNEATKLLIDKAEKSAEGFQIGSLETVDGFKWLWSKNISEEILPGLEPEDLKEIIDTAHSRENSKLETKTEINILIVEDEETSANMLSKFISNLGEISIYPSAESALEACTNSSFDLIFLDVGLPGISGLEFLEKFRKAEEEHDITEDASALIFILTADKNPQSAMKSFSHGANGYISKPLDKKVIAEELSKFGVEIPS